MGRMDLPDFISFSLLLSPSVCARACVCVCVRVVDYKFDDFLFKNSFIICV